MTINYDENIGYVVVEYNGKFYWKPVYLRGVPEKNHEEDYVEDPIFKTTEMEYEFFNEEYNPSQIFNSLDEVTRECLRLNYLFKDKIND